MAAPQPLRYHIVECIADEVDPRTGRREITEPRLAIRVFAGKQAREIALTEDECLRLAVDAIKAVQALRHVRAWRNS